MHQAELSSQSSGTGTRSLAARFREPLIGTILICVGLAVLAAAAYLAPSLTAYGLAALGLGIPLALLLWHRPEFGLLLIMFLMSSLVPSDVVDLRLAVGGGLEMRDLVLVVMLGLLILRGLIHKTLPIPWLPVSTPLLIFLGLAVLSALYALLYRNVASNWALNDLRIMLFYSVFFVAAWSVTSRRQLTTVLVGLFILADLIAGVVILQQFLGTNNTVLAAMSSSNWQLYEVGQASGGGGFGMVRIMPPGVVLVYFAMLLAFCLAVLTPQGRAMRIFLVGQFVYLNIGLLLTYTRALWLAAALAVGLSLIVLFPAYRAKLPRYLATGFVLLLLLAALLFGLLGTNPRESLGGARFARSFIERGMTILAPQEALESNSLQWRAFETEVGLRALSEHPLMGVGLGDSYRAITPLQGEALGWMTRGDLSAGVISRFTRFIHNSYLSIAVKMGLPALACFLWFCVALIISSWRLYRMLSERQLRAIALAVPAGLVGLMFWSVFHQHFVQTESTAIIGLMAGLVASLHHWFLDQDRWEQPSRRNATSVQP